jgi:hypothetical protein
MNEHTLHSEIKEWYSLPGDEFEVKVGGFIVDIVRGDLLIEIQTQNFSAIKKKLIKLARDRPIRLVHPIARRKWIVHTTESGEVIRRRKSPRKGRATDLYWELVSFPDLVKIPHFSLDVLLVDVEELRCNDGKGSWRRRGVSIKDRRLLNVESRTLIKTPTDLLKTMPTLPEQFTNRSLASHLHIPIHLARKITYCLRKTEVCQAVGKKGRALIFKTVS